MREEWKSVPLVEAKERVIAPSWALQQQRMFDTLNKAAKEIEQRYTTAETTGFNTQADAIERTSVNSKWLADLPPAERSIKLRIGMERYMNRPCYDMPWSNPFIGDPLLSGRQSKRGAIH
ncbi:hypothetical protein [Paenibacillus roseipurpureus]|uniref:Uncharacterized protein n=1 Tax=Paenibacillus roseopurpureus TaxID=2918901 RepID=A0AA96LN33_9BACL|nr:hypothetical protein [Paenibacillus sp. MBLB1832]WNR42864.1 hypothetical protein MJB10_17280 [Paenibacillus sp. MBLB1832]